MKIWTRHTITAAIVVVVVVVIGRQVQQRWAEAVWPDVAIKRTLEIFPKVTTDVFSLKVMIFRIAQKWPKIWATFEIKFVAKNFRNSPNLITLKGGSSGLEFANFCNTQSRWNSTKSIPKLFPIQIHGKVLRLFLL